MANDVSAGDKRVVRDAVDEGSYDEVSRGGLAVLLARVVNGWSWLCGLRAGSAMMGDEL